MDFAARRTHWEEKSDPFSAYPLSKSEKRPACQNTDGQDVFSEPDQSGSACTAFLGGFEAVHSAWKGGNWSKISVRPSSSSGSYSISLEKMRAVSYNGVRAAVYKAVTDLLYKFRIILYRISYHLVSVERYEDVVGVFESPLKKFILAVANVIKKIPLDAVEEIFENGIVLSGGGAKLYGIDKMLSKVLGISVTLASAPMDCVAKGLARINSILPIKMRSQDSDITQRIGKYYEAKNQNKK
jgi:hypothetical protein